MGRLIDIDVLFDYFGNDAISETVRSNIEYFVSEKGAVEAIPKDQYEARLKADMVAMLKEIQSEIREYHEIGCDEDCNNCRMVGCIEPVNVIKDLDIIQQKIEQLKENKKH